jgi:hypothetical protein
MDLGRTIACLALIGGACGHPRPVESYAIGALRTANGALQAYRAACGGYPSTITSLRGPDASTEAKGCLDRYLMDPGLITRFERGLAAPEGEEYALVYRPIGQERYEALAIAIDSERPTRRSFWTSEAGIVRFANGRTASAADEALR